MADVKISALPASTTPLAGTEVLPIVQSSTTKQVSVANLTAGRAVSALSLTSTTTLGVTGIASIGPNPIAISGADIDVGNNRNSPTRVGVSNQNSGASATAGIELEAAGGGWKIDVPADTATFVNPLIFSFNTTEQMRISGSGLITMSAYGAGAATFSAAGVISSVSDETYKIKDGVIADPMPMIMALDPGYYYGKPEANMGDGRQLGFYAQNVRAAIGPEAAPDPETYTVTDKDGVETIMTKPWGYYDRSVLAVAIEAIKVQQAQITALTARIAALENK